MYCANCGKQLPEGSKFCGGCGARQSQNPNSDYVLTKTQGENAQAKQSVTVNTNAHKIANNAPKKRSGIIITLIIIGVLILAFVVGCIGGVVSGELTPIETFSVETREFTFNNPEEVTINVKGDYTLNNRVDDTENQVVNGASRIKEFSFGNEYCNNTYTYTYADGAFADWSDGDIISLSGSALLYKSLNDNTAIPGYVDSYVETLKTIESINSEDVTVNITDNGDYISANFTFSNLSGSSNSIYVNAVAKWLGVSTVDGAIKDSDLSACLENNGYTVKEY